MNKTLLEMYIGMVFYGLICGLVVAAAVDSPGMAFLSLWLGVALAMAAAAHMYWSLDRALDQGDAAQKLVSRDYMIRYVSFATILIIAGMTGVLKPLFIFVGYMALKISAYLQPLVHRLRLKICHETDPVPAPVEEPMEESNLIENTNS